MRNVLVTGGTGSFGKAFVARLLGENHPGKIAVYSRGELAQANMAAKFQNDKLRFFIGDVRDYDRLAWAVRDYDTIIHAAALKRIEVGYYNPEEMVRTNVDGTINVVRACRQRRAMDAQRHVVMLSTDKACEPISPYGMSKALAEEIILGANRTSGPGEPYFSVVRYGNVAGSAGSVIPVWRAEMVKAKAEGRTAKLKVTNPGCTRFWLHMDDAINAVKLTAEGEYAGRVTPRALKAYQLGDLAIAMNEDCKAEWDITGLPDYEKVHESMLPGQSSEHAERMSIAELRGVLRYV